MRMFRTRIWHENSTAGGASAWERSRCGIQNIAGCAGSCAIPLVFPPVRVRANGGPERLLVDGGIRMFTDVRPALALGCREISLGRTALEPKARLGARPEPFEVWVKHRAPGLSALLGGLLSAIPHAEAPERNPFKAKPR